MGLLNDAGSWLAEKLQTAAGVSVSYARVAGGSAIAMTAWVGRSAVGTEQGNVRYHQWGDRDYLIAAADLAVAGVMVEPRLGDRITETISGTSCVFEVKSDEAGQHWRYSDQSRTMIRLHVKRVS